MVDRIGNVMKLLDTEEYPLCLNDFTSLLDEMEVEYDVYTVNTGADNISVSRVTVYDDEDETVLISYFVTGGLIRTEIL